MRVDVRVSVNIFYVPAQPFTWRFVSARSRCGAERILQLSPATPSRDRACRCAFFRGSVQTLVLHFSTLSRGSACRRAPAVVRRIPTLRFSSFGEFFTSSMHPLRGSSSGLAWKLFFWWKRYKLSTRNALLPTWDGNCSFGVQTLYAECSSSSLAWKLLFGSTCSLQKHL